MIGTTPPTINDNVLSLDRILSLRGEAFATIRRDSAHVAMIATHVEALDVALQTNADSRSIDEQQHLVDAARRLATLLEGEVCE